MEVEPPTNLQTQIQPYTISYKCSAHIRALCQRYIQVTKLIYFFCPLSVLSNPPTSFSQYLMVTQADREQCFFVKLLFHDWTLWTLKNKGSIALRMTTSHVPFTSLGGAQKFKSRKKYIFWFITLRKAHKLQVFRKYLDLRSEWEIRTLHNEDICELYRACGVSEQWYQWGYGGLGMQLGRETRNA